ncbi:hypothetical protein BDQ17DRAFT_1351458 [Cyathus striatus]|nr:hypothetical protein BDQ17DRAFT_1351458 [Cyathus striatus]
MDRRRGMEAALGTYGVTRASQKNFEIAEQLFSQGKQEAAWPYMRKALEDVNNLDARIGLAILLSKDKKTAITILKSAEIKGKENLLKQFGPKCFDDDGEQVGHFWEILDTRPYMRVLKNLAEIYNDNKQHKESADAIIEMLRLCPGDNLCNRVWLGSHLLRIGRDADALYFAQVRLIEAEYVSLIQGGTAFKPPARKLIPVSEEDRYKYSRCALLYTAALASFRLWGDCPESQQYLKLAARSNPLILLKVLGKIRQPEKPNQDPRVLNGPEDAHDYLWLTQDLWMKPYVWNWANDNPDCSREGCEKVEIQVAEFKRCSACHKVYYCTTKCQNADWKNSTAPPMYAADFSEEGIAIVEGC